MKCDKAKLVCDKSQYKESSLWERFKLSLHLFHCKECKNYSCTNKKLTQLLKKVKIFLLSQNDKEQLKQKLDRQISKPRS